jgi:AcrR family transcriptional regulator
MPRTAATTPGQKRVPLSRERVLEGALAVADAEGVAALTIRSLAEHLGVKPMALYHHIANKSEIIDGIVDLVYGEIELPAVDGDWRGEMERRARSAREVLRRHPWAIGLLQSRTSPGPGTLRHHDAVLGTLRQAGFSVPMTAHAFALIDSYLYGFALSEASLPINGPDTVAEVAGSMMLQYVPADYPHLSEFSSEHILRPGYDFGREFEFGLALVLDGLARALTADQATAVDDQD